MDVQRKAIEATENLLNLQNTVIPQDNCCQKLLSDHDCETHAEIVNYENKPLARLDKGSPPFGKMVRPIGFEPTTFGSASSLTPSVYPCTTPVIKRVWIAMRTQILGAIAVKTAVILDADFPVLETQQQARLQEYKALRYACGEILRVGKP